MSVTHDGKEVSVGLEELVLLIQVWHNIILYSRKIEWSSLVMTLDKMSLLGLGAQSHNIDGIQGKIYTILQMHDEKFFFFYLKLNLPNSILEEWMCPDGQINAASNTATAEWLKTAQLIHTKFVCNFFFFLATQKCCTLQ